MDRRGAERGDDHSRSRATSDCDAASDRSDEHGNAGHDVVCPDGGAEKPDSDDNEAVAQSDMLTGANPDAERLRALHDAATELSDASSAAAVYDAAVAAADRLLGFAVCEVFEHDDGCLRLAAASNPEIPQDLSFDLSHGVLGTTYLENRTIVVEDADDNEVAEPSDSSLRSGVSVPIGDYGVFQAISRQPGAYDQTDAELAEVLVAHVEAALDRLETERKLRRQTERTQQLHAVATDLESCHTHEALFDLVIDAAGEVLGFEWCAVLTVEDDRFVAAAASDGAPASVGDRLLAIDEGMVGYAYQTGMTAVTGDVREHDRSKPVDDAIRSALAVPIGDVGVLNAVSATTDAFTEADVELTELLASSVTEAHERIKVQQRLRDRQEELDLLKQIQSRVLRHNIRNDLSTIQMAAEKLQSDPDADRAKLCSLILDRTDALVTTSEKARRMEQVLERRERVTLNLDAVTESVTTALDEVHPAATVTVSTTPATVRVHPDLPTAIENLVENAIVHTGPEPTVQVTVRVDGDEAVCQITDDGPGIPPHETAVLHRNEETDLEHGSGAGLWLVRWIVDRSGGALSFHRQDGKTTVELRVPMADSS